MPTRDTQPLDGPGEPLADLVARALEGLEREGPAALESLCRAHPSQATALRARVDQLRAIGFVGSPPRDAALPERLGDFRILARLGSGGMGVVLLAEQQALGRQVALKLVRPDLLYFPGARERFRREVEAVARLAHPGIVPVYAAGEENGIPFCAMERVRGASLEEVITALAGRDVSQFTGAHLRKAVEAVTKKHDAALAEVAGARGSHTGFGSGGSGSGGSGSVANALFAGSWAEACVRVARAVAEALHHAHGLGVLHRDVKPSNVMLTPDGRVLLLDFGLATAAGSERLTGSGAALGSLAWMSPEQVRGAGEVDARSDVYSLAATLFELLSLRAPFGGGDVEAVRGRILEGRHIPLRDLNPSVPRDVETVIQKAMDPVRERRYADAADFAADLGNALELRPVAARRPGALLKTARWAQRHPARAVAAALAVVVLVGGPVGYGVLQTRAADEQRKLNDQLAARGVELQDSLAEATRQREISERGRQRTLEAIDQFLQEVGSNDLENLPGFEETRIELLERALAFYRELEAEQPGDRTPLIERARTRRAIADIVAQLGRDEEARTIYLEVAGTARELLARTPDDVPARSVLAGCLTQAAVLDQSAGRLDAARAGFDESAAIFEDLVARPDAQPRWLRDFAVNTTDRARLADFTGQDEQEAALYLRAAELAGRSLEQEPGSLDYAVLRASALRGAATAAIALGRADESEQQLRDGWRTVKDLRAAHPHDRLLRAEIVETGNNLGLLLMSRADRSEALAVLQESFAAASSLAEDFPRDDLLQNNAGAIGINVAAELGNQRRFAEAAPVIEEACVQLERVVRHEPGSVEHAFYYAAALSVAGGMHLELGDHQRAVREGEDSVRIMREVFAALSDSQQVANQLASVLFQMADTRRGTNDRAAALATLEEAFALGGGRPDILFQGAEIAGHLAKDAHAAAEAPTAARSEQICLALLGEAVDKGFTDPLRLRAPVFDSLAGQPAFEAIAGRIAASP